MSINWNKYPSFTSLNTSDKIIVSAPDGNTKKVPASAIATTDTLQTVTNNGNTTTNSIMIGSSSNPTKKLNINQTADSEGIRITGYDNENNSHLDLYVDNFGNDYITSSEFLGIHSGGSARIRAVGYLRLESASAGNAVEVNTNYLKFTTGGSERARLTNTGLGIGTSSPGYPLDVVSNSSTNAAKFRVRSTNDFGNINFSSYDGTETLGSIYFDRTGTSIGNLRFYTSSTANTEKMRLTSAGNLLLATTTDDGYKLNVNGNVRIGQNDRFYINNANVGLRRDSNDLVLGGFGGIRFLSSSTDISNQTERMRILSNGRIGLGTASPNAALDIQAGTADFRLTSTGQNRTALANTSTGFQVSQTGNKAIYFETNGNERARITGGGNLGIGTSSPVSNYRTHILGVGRPILLDSSNAVSIAKISNSSTGNSSYNGLDLVVNSTTSNIIKSYGMPLLFSTSDTNGVNSTEKMRLTSAGNLGLGVTSPALQSGGTGLHINASAHSEIKFTNSTTGTASTDGTAFVSSGVGFTINNREAGNLVLKTNNTTRATIDSAGATTLSGSLAGTTAVFSGQVSAGTHFKLQNGGKLYSNASNVTLQSASSSYLGFNISTSEKARITTNGLLIGTTTDSAAYKLNVNGKAKAQSLDLTSVLTLKATTTPANPTDGHASIYMDSSDGAIKVKINVGGTVVTRTLALYEG